MKPIKVLHVVGKMERGGAETWLMRILRNIDRDRFRMDFLVHVNEECAYDAEIRSLGSRIIACTESWPWAYDRSIKEAMHTHGPYDIVHSQLYLFSGFIMRSAMNVGVPVRIAHMHPLRDVDEGRVGRAMLKRRYLSWLKQYATCFLAPSQTTMDSFREVCDCSRQYTDIVYNCLDLKPFQVKPDRTAIRRELGLPLELPIITYIGRFVPHKNHEMLLRVADIINQDRIRAYFVMAGSRGPVLEDLRAKTGKRKDISILPDIHDVSKLLLASDLFLFPSLEEGFGVVAIEAAAAGLPVVATDIPTIREACAPSHHTLMFSPNDHTTAARHVLSVLNNDQLREKLANDARDWASRFSIKQSVDKLVSVYERCLEAES